MSSPRKKIRLVDGFAIRSRLDPDFGAIDQHRFEGFAPKFYIPEGEIWIDRKFKAEKDYMLALERFEEQLFKKGTPFQRMKRMAKKKFLTKNPRASFVMSREKQKGLIICMVDGALVRRHLDPYFIYGGHHLIYNYVPKNEIWIDMLQDERELPYHLLHELAEYRLMNEGLTYDAAHDIATALDKAERRKDGIGHYPGDATYTRKYRIPHALT